MLSLFKEVQGKFGHMTKWFCEEKKIDLIGFFVQWHVNLQGLFNAKAIPVKEY